MANINFTNLINKPVESDDPEVVLRSAAEQEQLDQQYIFTGEGLAALGAVTLTNAIGPTDSAGQTWVAEQGPKYITLQKGNGAQLHIQVGSDIVFKDGETSVAPLTIPEGANDFAEQNTGTFRVVVDGETYEVPINGLAGDGSGDITLNGNTSIDGDLIPGTNDVYNLGSLDINPSNEVIDERRWKDIYLSGQLNNSGEADGIQLSGTITYATDHFSDSAQYNSNTNNGDLIFDLNQDEIINLFNTSEVLPTAEEGIEAIQEILGTLEVAIDSLSSTYPDNETIQSFYANARLADAFSFSTLENFQTLLNNFNMLCIYNSINPADQYNSDEVNEAIEIYLVGTRSNINNDTISFNLSSVIKNTEASIYTEGGICAEKNIWAKRVFNAVFNDYAEYRTTINLTPGHVVIDQDDGSLACSTARLQPGAQVISDTFGHAMGQTFETTTPLAVAGRVLAYTYQPRENYHAGMAVCSAPGGTVDIMTREEIRDYPDCIVGIVSEIPQYEIWGSDNVKVDGRIWIKI